MDRLETTVKAAREDDIWEQKIEQEQQYRSVLQSMSDNWEQIANQYGD
jgi:hypothetical protein